MARYKLVLLCFLLLSTLFFVFDNTKAEGKTSFEFQYKETKSKIIIGDKTVFKPKVKISKWDDNHYFSLEINGIGLFTPTVDAISGKVEGKVKDQDFSITYLQMPVNPDFNDNGGLDIIITQGKEGLSNVISFTYSAQNVVGYLQPPLTPAEIAEGAVRPDHVVNSIVFYATDKGGSQEVGGIEWKTGKVGHLYRMKATSYDGKVAPVWCDWSISGNVVSLIIPFTFWNNSKTKFPITIAPVGDTFGYTTQGTTSVKSIYYAQGQLANGAVGTATKLTFYGRGKSSGTGNVIGGIYLHSTLALITNGSTSAVACGNSNAWYDLTFPTNPTVAASEYVLAVCGQEFTSNVWYDVGGATEGHDSYYTYTSPIGNTFYLDAHRAYKYSIYCTYTPAAGYYGILKYWDGDSWELKTLKYWNGASWVSIKPTKAWDGDSWEEVKTKP